MLVLASSLVEQICGDTCDSNETALGIALIVAVAAIFIAIIWKD